MIVALEGWANGERVCAVDLEHGADPFDLLAGRGWAVTRPREAVLADGRRRLLVRLEVTARSVPAPRPRRVGTDRRLVLAPGEVPVPVQRVGAYALVRSARGLLAAEHSQATGRPGTWGLPGGGLDPGEQPAEAARRECWEETGQRVEIGSLLFIQAAHWVGRSPSGRAEDFHAVRLIYRGSCAGPTDPVVHDGAGTTASARWVPEPDLGAVRWSIPAREQLTWLRLLPAG